MSQLEKKKTASNQLKSLRDSCSACRRLQRQWERIQVLNNADLSRCAMGGFPVYCGLQDVNCLSLSVSINLGHRKRSSENRSLGSLENINEARHHSPSSSSPSTEGSWGPRTDLPRTMLVYRSTGSDTQQQTRTKAYFACVTFPIQFTLDLVSEKN